MGGGGGGSGSSSDTQIFNCSKLKRRIENGILGLPLPEPLGPGGGGGGGGRSTLLPAGGRRFCPYALAGQALQ